MNDILLKTSQVAATLGCCERTVLRMCEKGLLRPYRFGVGKQRRFSLADVRRAAEMSETLTEQEDPNLSRNDELGSGRESTAMSEGPLT